MKGPTRNSRPACARPDRTRVTTALPDGHSPIFSPERAPRQGHPGLCGISKRICLSASCGDRASYTEHAAVAQVRCYNIVPHELFCRVSYLGDDTDHFGSWR
jgi:hypothetical protein